MAVLVRSATVGTSECVASENNRNSDLLLLLNF
jgi:hypothetical protein